MYCNKFAKVLSFAQPLLWQETTTNCCSRQLAGMAWVPANHKLKRNRWVLVDPKSFRVKTLSCRQGADKQPTSSVAQWQSLFHQEVPIEPKARVMELDLISTALQEGSNTWASSLEVLHQHGCLEVQGTPDL